MRKQKKIIFICILFLAVGFATITTTLLINGTILIGVDKDSVEGDVIFTDAKGEDGSRAEISADGKSITFNTSELKSIGQESILNYEVTNKSRQYDVDVDIRCQIDGSTLNDNEYVTMEVNPESMELGALERTRGNIKLKLIKSMVDEGKEMEFSCELVATAKSRSEIAEAGVSLNNGNDTVNATVSSKGEVSFNAEDTSNKTNILCNNGAVPTIEGDSIKVSNVTSKTKCYLNESLADVNEELDDSLTNILMLKDELDIPDSGECLGASTGYGPEEGIKEDAPRNAAVCINKDYNNIVLNLNGKKITSSAENTIFVNADSEFRVKGSGYIGNNNIEDQKPAAILISGADLYIESSKADKCTNNPNDTTNGLCLYAYAAINNWIAKSKSYTYLKNISLNGQLNLMNGDADITDLDIVATRTDREGETHASAIFVSKSGGNITINGVHYVANNNAIGYHSNSGNITINGGHYESYKNDAISIYDDASSTLTINDYPTYIKVKDDNGKGILLSGPSKLVINGSEADTCTENGDDLTSGLCVYGLVNVYLENGANATINGGTYKAIGDTVHVRYGATVQIKGGNYLSNNTKALTCRLEDTTCYVNGGTFESKNLGEEKITTNTDWGTIVNEGEATLYISNANLIGKRPLVMSHDLGKTYICSGTFNSSSGFDVTNNANANAHIYYSNLVKFTDLTNTPSISGSINNVTGNYTGSCTP